MDGHYLKENVYWWVHWQSVWKKTNHDHLFLLSHSWRPSMIGRHLIRHPCSNANHSADSRAVFHTAAGADWQPRPYVIFFSRKSQDVGLDECCTDCIALHPPGLSSGRLPSQTAPLLYSAIPHGSQYIQSTGHCGTMRHQMNFPVNQD